MGASSSKAQDKEPEKKQELEQGSMCPTKVVGCEKQDECAIEKGERAEALIVGNSEDSIAKDAVGGLAGTHMRGLRW